MTVINVDRLTLKLSGVSQQDGQRLAKLVADKLGDREISLGSVQDVSSLQMRITAQTNGNMGWLADQIVSEILRHLNRNLA